MSNSIKYLFLFGLLLCVFFLQLLVGEQTISWADLWVNSIENLSQLIIWKIRFPAAITAFICGASLGVSGLFMQTLFRNPIAGPYVLGVSAGASFGVVLFSFLVTSFSISLVFLDSWGLLFFAISGAFLTLLLLFTFLKFIQTTATLLIVGLMIGGLLSSFSEILTSLLSANSLKGMFFWNMGSFKNTNWGQISVFGGVVLVTICSSFFFLSRFNLLLVGDDYAQTMGLELKKIRKIILIQSAILAACATAFCGPIAFVGLGVPQIVRSFFKTTHHQITIPASILIGAIICGVCNLFSSIEICHTFIPVNAITSLFGAPLVIWIMLKNNP